jgi:hypothetical protein
MKHTASKPKISGYAMPFTLLSVPSWARTRDSARRPPRLFPITSPALPRKRKESNTEELLGSMHATLLRLEAKLGTPELAARLLDREQAAAAVGVGVRTFERHIAPELGRVQVGTRVLYPTAEIERWVGARTLRPARRR